MKEDFMKTQCILLSALLMMAPVASAEILRGDVQNVLDSGNELKLRAFNPQTHEREEVLVEVHPLTQVEGVVSVSQLQIGDEVLIDAARDSKTGHWSADSIQTVEEPRR
jgi:hypothetical protein